LSSLEFLIYMNQSSRISFIYILRRSFRLALNRHISVKDLWKLFFRRERREAAHTHNPVESEVGSMLLQVYQSLDLKMKSVTWLNHSSFLRLAPLLNRLGEFTSIGIDGTYLQLLLSAGIKRTSADQELPAFLGKKNLKVFLVGGKKEDLNNRLITFERRFPLSEVLLNIDGYSENLAETIDYHIVRMKPDLVILGLGAPLQEMICLDLMNMDSSQNNVLVVTCGGWLDQIQYQTYYPFWAYPLRLNWLVRLAREPKRLWKRYTFDALKILTKKKDLKTLLQKSKIGYIP
jgi:exopolysaccharide biosynthesis WecB/TagA/CpsF family protein